MSMYRLYVGTIILAVLSHFKAQDVQCPSLDELSDDVKARFSPEHLAMFCNETQEWNAAATESANVMSDAMLTPAQAIWLDNVQTCWDLICLCKIIEPCKLVLDSINSTLTQGTQGTQDLIDKLNSAGNLDSLLGGLGGKNSLGRKRRQIAEFLQPAIRKEYRMLTEDERNRFNIALNKLKFTQIDGVSKYDLLVIWHTPENAPGAHFGAALLPFHRELLKQLEIAMRLEDPSIAIPYWDSTLDSKLPNASDSIIWTGDFLGNGKGVVKSGPFKDWQAYPHPKALQVSPTRVMVRDTGGNQFGSLYRDSDITKIGNFDSLDKFTLCVDPYFELLHGAAHMWVGGLMEPLEASPNDPAFFLLHAFVDCIFEDFRQQKQTREQRESAYPPEEKCCNAYHYPNAPMKPFKIKNIQGLSNDYEKYFRYQSRPTCSSSKPSCDSPYIFCDTRVHKCVSKVRVGGNCTGYDDLDVCYQGSCLRGVCMSGMTTGHNAADLQTTIPVETTIVVTETTTAAPTVVNVVTTTSGKNQPTTPPIFLTSSDAVWMPVTVLRQLPNGTLAPADQVELRTRELGVPNVTPLPGIVTTSTNYPNFPGAAYIQIPNPFQRSSGHVDAKIDIRTVGSIKCIASCYKDGQSTTCEPIIHLDKDPRKSDQIAFTPYRDQVAYLSWNGPTRLPTYLTFTCRDNNAATLAPISVVQVTTKAPGKTDATCINRHRCCDIWAPAGECRRNYFYMRAACARGCQQCRATRSTECVDLFAECASWAANKQCAENPEWMEENCKKSCDVCDRPIEDLQQLCGAGHSGCDNFDPDCQKWASQGECKKNYWWMKENCPLACNECTQAG